MKDHIAIIAGLLAIMMLLVTAIVMAVHGIKEEAILMVLFQGAVSIGSAIVGIKAVQAANSDPKEPKGPTT